MHVFINCVSMETEVAVSRSEVAQRVTLRLTSARSCIHPASVHSFSPSISGASCLAVTPPPPPPESSPPERELAPVPSSFKASREACPGPLSCYWDLKQEEHVAPLSFSKCGVMVSTTSDWSKSFSLAMMCFTKQLAASSMLMFSCDKRKERDWLFIERN